MGGTRGWAALVLAAGALAPGCSRTRPETVTVDGTITQTRLTNVAALYGLYVAAKGKAPASLAEMNAFGQSVPVADGGPITIPEAALTSPRNKSPIVVRYGLPVRPAAKGAGDTPVVAYEREGVDGRRFVVRLGSGLIEQVDEARFRELVPES